MQVNKGKSKCPLLRVGHKNHNREDSLRDRDRARSLPGEHGVQSAISPTPVVLRKVPAGQLNGVAVPFGQ